MPPQERRQRIGTARDQAFPVDRLILSDSNPTSFLGIHSLPFLEDNRCVENISTWLGSFFLSAALMVPIGALAMPRPQDEPERHEQEEREHRVYDPANEDYHNWDAREDEAYRRWLEKKHEAYVDYDRLDRKRQEEY